MIITEISGLKRMLKYYGLEKASIEASEVLHCRQVAEMNLIL